MDDRPGSGDLEAIRRMMEEAQSGAPDSGKHFLLWGAVTAVGLVGTYINLNGPPEATGWLWGVAIALGWAVAMWVGWREQSRARVQNLMNSVVAGIWIGTSVSVTLVVIGGLYLKAFAASALPGATSLVIGGGFFASSFAYRSAWLRAMAIGWWVGGSAMLAWRGPYTLLLMAGLVVAFDIVPGIVLFRRANASRAARAA